MGVDGVAGAGGGGGEQGLGTISSQYPMLVHTERSCCGMPDEVPCLVSSHTVMQATKSQCVLSCNLHAAGWTDEP